MKSRIVYQKPNRARGWVRAGKGTPPKENGPPGMLHSGRVVTHKPSDFHSLMPSNIKKRGASLYPVEDFEALNIDSPKTSDDDEREGLDPKKGRVWAFPKRH